MYSHWYGTPAPFRPRMLMSIPVRQARNASRVGCTGIVVQETANTFKVVTKANTLKGLTLSSFGMAFFLLDLQSSQSKEPFLQSPCLISHRLRLLRILTLGLTLNYTETSSDSVQPIVPLENSKQKRPPNSNKETGLPPSPGANSAHPSSSPPRVDLTLPSFAGVSRSLRVLLPFDRRSKSHPFP